MDLIKFVPPEKRSKKVKKELDRLTRKSWNGVRHCTKTIESATVYNRHKAKAELRRAADM